jgi:predicted amidohydrolase YtcJ
LSRSISAGLFLHYHIVGRLAHVVDQGPPGYPYDGAPIRRLLDGGVPVARSTDGVPYSMLWAAWEAITRWDEDGQRQLGEGRLTPDISARACQNFGQEGFGRSAS